MLINQVFLKNKRSHGEIWKKEDIEKKFEIVEYKEIFEKTNKPVKAFNKFSSFLLMPTSRFDSLNGEKKLKDYNDVLYFKIIGLDRDSDEVFVRYIDCGFAITKRESFRTFKI